MAINNDRYKLDTEICDIYDFGKDKYGTWKVLTVESETELEAYMYLNRYCTMEFIIGVPKDNKCYVCPPEERHRFLETVDALIDDEKEYYINHYAPELMDECDEE